MNTAVVVLATTGSDPGAVAKGYTEGDRTGSSSTNVGCVLCDYDGVADNGDVAPHVQENMSLEIHLREIDSNDSEVDVKERSI